MKAALLAMFVALLMVGCGEYIEVQDIEVPKLINCDGCGKEVSSKGEACFNCSHPIVDSIEAYKEMRAAIPFGGLEVLAKIREAKEKGAPLLES